MLATLMIATIPTQNVYAGTNGQQVQVQTIYLRPVRVTGTNNKYVTKTWVGKAGTYGWAATGFAKTNDWWFQGNVKIEVQNGDGYTWTTCSVYVQPNQGIFNNWADFSCAPKS
jgi:hypothetical protein